MMVRQGDVLLMPVQAIPGAASKGERHNGQIVLAWGEITGHRHAISDEAVQILEHEGTRYIRVPNEGADLKHEGEGGTRGDHDTIALAPGDYQIIQQKEYTPKAIVNVLD